MTPFPFLTVFIILLIAYSIRRTTLTRRREQREEAFWAREKEAEHAPARDLSTLEYIRVPVERFSFGAVDDDELSMLEEELLTLAKKPLLNLDGRTNTDVRLDYGAANFDAVSQMGEDYDRLIVVLCDYAKGLMEAGREDLASGVLEYGVEIGTDISANYTLLGDCYRHAGEEAKLAGLRSKVEASQLLLKDSILRQLD